jgi:signal transduction histidine kinase
MAASALRLLGRLQQHRVVALVAGVTLELVAVLLISLDTAVRDTRGIGGESVVLLAVFGALAAGPVVGAAMAIAGWALFFPLIADDAPGSIIALPLWVLTTYAVGFVSARLVRSERTHTRAELEVVAAHELRTPVAVILGMARSLRRHQLGDEERDKLLELIETESENLLAREPFRGDDPAR